MTHFFLGKESGNIFPKFTEPIHKISGQQACFVVSTTNDKRTIIRNTFKHSFDADIKSIKSGYKHSLILLENGEVYELPEVSEIKKIDVPKARKIYSAAYDDFIQLEDGSFIAHGTHAGNTHRHMMIEDNTQDFYTNTLQPCKAMILDADESVVTMDCGYKYVMYYTSKKRLFGAGYNGDGQLGHNRDTWNISQTDFPFGTIKKIRCAFRSTAFLTATSEVYICGYLNHDVKFPTITKLDLPPIKTMSAGGFFFIFQTLDDCLIHYGQHINGELQPKEMHVNCDLKVKSSGYATCVYFRPKKKPSLGAKMITIRKFLDIKIQTL